MISPPRILGEFHGGEPCEGPEGVREGLAAVVRRGEDAAGARLEGDPISSELGAQGAELF